MSWGSVVNNRIERTWRKEREKGKQQRTKWGRNRGSRGRGRERENR